MSVPQSWAWPGPSSWPSVVRVRIASSDVAVRLDALVQARFLTARVLDGQPVYRFARETDRPVELTDSLSENEA